jgi:DNA-directed RNA polymerase subunit RPC12/RpoP
MPIEFRCSECSRLLRTPDDTAGKRAKCPQCGAILAVPKQQGGVPDETLPYPGKPPSGPIGDPFAPRGAETADQPASENPYQAPMQYGAAPPQPSGWSAQYAAGRVSGPAIGLIVTGAIGLPFQILAVVLQLWGVGFEAMQGGGAPQGMMMLHGGINMISSVVGILVGVVIIIGAVKMKNLDNYGFAMTSAIVAMIPCLSPCCILGLPFGIWALVVLSDVQVKGAFRG